MSVAMPAVGAAGKRWRRPKQAPPARNRGEGRDAWLLVLPALLPVVLFSVYPLLRGIYLGFTDTHAAREISSPFNGLENYRTLLDYDLFWRSFRIGVIWTLSVTIIQFFASLGLALLLNMDLRLRWLARTLALVPWAMPPVIVAIMWRLMLNPNHGPINQGLEALGFGGDINWLGDPAWALRAVIVVGVWAGMPQTTITLLAGLQQVDDSLHEAAAIDGANVTKRFRHVSLPMIRGAISTVLVLLVIGGFNVFTSVLLMTNGGPLDQTQVPLTYLYATAFRDIDFGYASAISFLLTMVVLAVAGLQFWWTQRRARAAFR